MVNVHDYPRKLPLAIAKAHGCWVTDVEGNEYLDCLAGAGTLALGHNHPAVIQAIKDVLDSGLPLHFRYYNTVKRCFTAELLSFFLKISIACSFVVHLGQMAQKRPLN